jgi:hypothetical protein
MSATQTTPSPVAAPPVADRLEGAVGNGPKQVFLTALDRYMEALHDYLAELAPDMIRVQRLADAAQQYQIARAAYASWQGVETCNP